MKEDNKTGKRIRELRDKLGLFQSDLAEKLDVQRANISKYENGTVIPPGDTIAELADILHTSADYLLGITDDPEINFRHNLRGSEEKALTDKLLYKLKYLVNDENCFRDDLREDIFKAISDNLYMAPAYHNASDHNYFIKHFTEYFSSLDELTDDDHDEMAKEFNKAYNYANVKKVIEHTDTDNKEKFLSRLQVIVEKHNIKNPDPLANEKEFNEDLFDKIKILTNKHGMDLTDPSTLDLIDNALDFIKRMKSK